LGGGDTSRALTFHAAEDALTVRNGRFNLYGLKWTRLQRIPKHPPDSSTASHEEYVENLLHQPVVHLGKGKSGSTFATTATPAIHRLFQKVLSHVMVNTLPRAGSLVVLKVIDLRKGTSMKDVVDYHKRETAAHLHICKHPPVLVGKNECSARLYPCQHVPYFYAFGVDIDHGMALTCMEFIPGVPISRVSLTSKIFLETQRVFCALWASGVTHNDAHFDNILVTPTSKVYLIDFEFSSILPISTRREFIDSLDLPLTKLDSAAQILFTRHTNAVQFLRSNGKMTFYNPGYKALRVLWKRMPPQERKKYNSLYKKMSVSCAMANA
jgi:serine/threonine protein kinase